MEIVSGIISLFRVSSLHGTSILERKPDLSGRYSGGMLTTDV